MGRASALMLTMLMLAACGGNEPEKAAESADPVSPSRNVVEAEPAPEPRHEKNINAATPSLEPPEDPALAEMSPYRRREYARGWRDCMTGNYDRERQGESYRLGCMAAENAKAGEEP